MDIQVYIYIHIHIRTLQGFLAKGHSEFSSMNSILMYGNLYWIPCLSLEGDNMGPVISNRIHNVGYTYPRWLVEFFFDFHVGTVDIT